MNLLTAVLSPAFLVDNIEIIAFIASVMILVFFDDFVVGRIIFPVADFVKYELAKGIDFIYETKHIASERTWAKLLRKYSSEAVATLLVIIYCYLGYEILGIYVIEPILERWKGVITIVILIMFLIVNYLVNDVKMRRHLFGFGVYNPEKDKKQIKKLKRALVESQGQAES